MLAHESGNPNASSAVIELRHGGDKIVFSADSEYQQWREIYRLRTNTPLKCKALTMPHHGGLMQGAPTDLQWFCNTATDAEVVVVSAATVNSHGHPKREVIQAVAASGSHVMCTQITYQCCSNLESTRPGVIGPMLYPCRSTANKDATQSGRSRNVACAGTIAANLDPTGIEIKRATDHNQAVSNLVATGSSPICR